MQHIPYNLEAEKSLLGCLLLDPNLKHKRQISPRIFYDLQHQKIMAAVQNMDKVDMVTLHEELPDIQMSFIAQIWNSVPTTSHFNKYVDIVEEKYTRRAVGLSLTDLAATILGDNDQLENTLEKIKQLILNTKTGNHYDVLTNPELIELWYANYDKPVQRIKTGIATIDRTIGGFSPTDFGLILADTNVGKTTLLLNMAVEMAKSGKHVLFFSLEMTADQLNDKFMAIYGRHHAFDISSRATPKDQLYGTVEGFKALPITVVHRGAITSRDVISEAYNRKITDKVDIVMVDYVQRLSDESKESETMRMGQIARNLKNFALVNETPVITPAQVDKESSKGGKIKVENVAWAKALADEADIAFYLYEQEKPQRSMVQTTNFQLERDLRLRVVKSRHSIKGQDILINFDRSTLRMNDEAGEIQDTISF